MSNFGAEVYSSFFLAMLDKQRTVGDFKAKFGIMGAMEETWVFNPSRDFPARNKSGFLFGNRLPYPKQGRAGDMPVVHLAARQTAVVPMSLLLLSFQTFRSHRRGPSFGSCQLHSFQAGYIDQSDPYAENRISIQLLLIWTSSFDRW